MKPTSRYISGIVEGERIMRNFYVVYTANGNTETCVVHAKNQADALTKILWTHSKDGVHITENCRVSVRPR